MTPPNPVGRPAMKKREEKPEFLTVDVGASDSIGDVSRRAVKLADAKKCPVRFTFKGMALEALPESDPWDTANEWFRAQKGKAS